MPLSAGLGKGGIGRLQIAHMNCDRLISLLVSQLAAIASLGNIAFKCGVLSSSPNVVVEHLWPNGWMCMVHVKDSVAYAASERAGYRVQLR